MKKLPIGLQDFRELRINDYLYVDKTAQVYRLVESAKYYFLSRPRRFGKSLLVSTLAELYKGSKELFEGLWIEDKWDWEKISPVLEFRFNSAAYKELGLEKLLLARLQE